MRSDGGVWATSIDSVRLTDQPKKVNQSIETSYTGYQKNKAGYTATPVASGWAGAIIEVTPSFGQEQ